MSPRSAGSISNTSRSGAASLLKTNCAHLIFARSPRPDDYFPFSFDNTDFATRCTVRVPSADVCCILTCRTILAVTLSVGRRGPEKKSCSDKDHSQHPIFIHSPLPCFILLRGVFLLQLALKVHKKISKLRPIPIHPNLCGV